MSGRSLTVTSSSLAYCTPTGHRQPILPSTSGRWAPNRTSSRAERSRKPDAPRLPRPPPLLGPRLLAFSSQLLTQPDNGTDSYLQGLPSFGATLPLSFSLATSLPVPA